ncbi:hypothetical protein UY3_13398 [Chelonia mydas]|uniref:Uncharacterized protein n=1 Tax=Chelonia mydas TaxID=8469 RepID=M7AVI0_CHEMY|nr:hypothetical protein UY3_13398 [Chelonia mydas]
MDCQLFCCDTLNVAFGYGPCTVGAPGLQRHFGGRSFSAAEDPAEYKRLAPYFYFRFSYSLHLATPLEGAPEIALPQAP